MKRNSLDSQKLSRQLSEVSVYKLRNMVEKDGLEIMLFKEIDMFSHFNEQ
jgi:hypothetical protein